MGQKQGKRELRRKLGVIALASTGICSMMGASIYIVPFMIQRHVPGIGPHVLTAFVLASIPAGLAAIAYALLASAMPRAGGSYVFGSRGLHPFWGFLASFSQWFGLSVAIGVIAYVIIAFVNDIFLTLDWEVIHLLTSDQNLRPIFALSLLWLFTYINLRGITLYRKILIPMMIGMFALGIVVVVIGFSMNHQEFLQDNAYRLPVQPVSWSTLLSAAAILFASFIGFDSIAQAGGEAYRPNYTLPRAIGMAFIMVGGFYFLFTAAVYHAIPWPEIAAQAMANDVSAPALFSSKLSSGITVLIISGAALALINDLPAMLLAVSRLVFAWAKDGLFDQKLASINKHQVPHHAILLSALVASLSILGCHFAGDFFLGVDIMVTSMLLNFLLMCVTIWTIRMKKPAYLARFNNFISPFWQMALSAVGFLSLSVLLIFHIRRDLNSTHEFWYHYATPIWIIVMVFGSFLYFRGLRRLKNRGVHINDLFSRLPDE